MLLQVSLLLLQQLGLRSGRGLGASATCFLHTSEVAVSACAPCCSGMDGVPFLVRSGCLLFPFEQLSRLGADDGEGGM